MPLPILSIIMMAMQVVSEYLDKLFNTTFFVDYFSAEAIIELAGWLIEHGFNWWTNMLFVKRGH